MIDVVEQLCRFEERAACTDAERRAALWLHDDLRRRGYDVWVETIWVRPQWAASLTLHAGLGVVASLLATGAELAACILAGIVTLSYALELAGYGGILKRLFVRRATQLVVVEPPREDGIALFISAATDAPRTGLIFAERWRRFANRLGPHPLWWVAIALLLITIAAAVRGSGAEGAVIGAVQFVPTIVLLVAAAVGLDVGLARISPGAAQDASGVAVALALHEELTKRPPQRLSAGIVLAGAGEMSPLGLDHYLRTEHREIADTVVLELGPCGSGEPAWTATHPQLREAIGTAPRMRAPRVGSRRRLPLARLRAVGPRGVPERVRTEHDIPEAVDQDVLDRTYEVALDCIDALDAQLVKNAPGAPTR